MRDGFPRAFAAPLDFNQVFSLAAPYAFLRVARRPRLTHCLCSLIKSCPADNPVLPFYTFPALTVASPKVLYHAGDVVNFSFDQKIGKSCLFPA